MRAGRLRHRVTIQRPGPITKSSFGEEVFTWVDFATVWGQVDSISGREFIEGQKIEAGVTTKIRVRFIDGVSPKWRATHGGHTYDIIAALPDENDRRVLMLMCQELIA